jgi:plasmid maintenance system antidote protein VapI
MNATQFSKCINGPFHLPGDVIAQVEKSCGNTAITQWLALQHGATIKIESEVERLRREVEELRQARAA